MFEDPFKLFLSRSPFLLGQMEISDEGPSIWVILIDLQRFFEPIGSFVDLTTVTRHAAETQVTIDVVAMFAENTLNQTG